MDNYRYVAAVLILGTILVVGAGIAAAAVSMDFSSEYDGENSNSVQGREITVSGEIDVTGDSATEPRITVRPTDKTVLDHSSVEVNLPAESGVQLDTHSTSNGVVITGDEIPAGTTVSIEFNVYPRGTGDVNITSAVIRMDYRTPGGQSQTEKTQIETSLKGGPEDRIQELENELNATNDGGDGGGGSTIDLRLIAGGALLLIVLIVVAGYIIGKRED